MSHPNVAFKAAKKLVASDRKAAASSAVAIVARLRTVLIRFHDSHAALYPVRYVCARSADSPLSPHIFVSRAVYKASL